MGDGRRVDPDEAVTAASGSAQLDLVFRHEAGRLQSYLLRRLGPRHYDLAEEAVYREFDRLSERGGVLGAMETMYQRSRIQEESLYYERGATAHRHPPRHNVIVVPPDDVG